MADHDDSVSFSEILDKSRYSLAILGGALLILAAEPLVLSGSTPVISGMAQADRSSLFDQVIVVTASLLGFMITAVAILVSLDGARDIVKRLKRGESFHLLVATMLWTIGVLFLLTLLGIVGAASETDAGASKWFERAYEWMGYAATGHVVLTLQYFAVVTYVVARHREPDG